MIFHFKSPRVPGLIVTAHQILGERICELKQQELAVKKGGGGS